MRLNLPLNFGKDRRKYPIQRRDDNGQSLRKRCFYLFGQGRNAYEAAEILDMKPATARRYFSQWNECPPVLEATYRRLKNELKTKDGLSPRIVGTLSTALGMPEWQVIDILSRPHGLKSLLMGKFAQMRKRQLYSAQEMRLEVALQQVVYLEQIGVPLEWILRETKELIQKAIRYVKSKNGLDSSQVFDDNA